MGADGSSGTSRPTMPDIKTLALEIIDGLIRSALDLDMQSEYEEAIEDVDVLLTAALKERDEKVADLIVEADALRNLGQVTEAARKTEEALDILRELGGRERAIEGANDE